MTSLQLFRDVWLRADMLTEMHTSIRAQGTALELDEILRAEWVARVSALDLYVHELVAQRMLRIQRSELPATPAFNKARVSAETASRMAAGSSTEASAAFDLDIRTQHSLLTFQSPDKIADAIRLTSNVELWNAIALRQGASTSEAKDKAKALKAKLSLIVERRNKIAHEGDLLPGLPRQPWAISEADVRDVRDFLLSVVESIDGVVAAGDVPPAVRVSVPAQGIAPVAQTISAAPAEIPISSPTPATNIESLPARPQPPESITEPGSIPVSSSGTAVDRESDPHVAGGMGARWGAFLARFWR
jgi:hypothetical protein